MAISTYIDRIKQIDRLIRMRNTGNPGNLASRLGISERMTYEYISIIREMGAQITFSKDDNSYVYENDVELMIGFFKTHVNN